MDKSLFAALPLRSLAASAHVPHVNRENRPVHSLAFSPGGKLLAVGHTVDAHPLLFAISEGRPAPVGHVLDPAGFRVFRLERSP